AAITKSSAGCYGSVIEPLRLRNASPAAGGERGSAAFAARGARGRRPALLPLQRHPMTEHTNHPSRPLRADSFPTPGRHRPAPRRTLLAGMLLACLPLPSLASEVDAAPGSPGASGPATVADATAPGQADSDGAVGVASGADEAAGTDG